MSYRNFDEQVSVPLHSCTCIVKNMVNNDRLALAPCTEAQINSSNIDSLENETLHNLVTNVPVAENDISLYNNNNSVLLHDNNSEINQGLNNNCQNDVRIMFWNIQGIGSKLELESINKLIFDIVLLSETMKQSTYNPLLLKKPSFHSL